MESLDLEKSDIRVCPLRGDAVISYVERYGGDSV